MNLLKPYFIQLFFIFTFSIFWIYLFSALFNPGTGNISICILSGSILFFFWTNYQAQKVHYHRFDNVVIYALFFCSLCIFLGAFFTQKDQSIYMLHSLVFFISWLLYELWYCQYPDVKNQQLRLGSTFRPSGLHKLGGKNYQFNNNDKRSIFIFYNGNWNHYCRSQINEINNYTDLIEEGQYQLFLISPQKEDKVSTLQKRTKLKAEFLLDKGAQFGTSKGLIQHNSFPYLIRFIGHKEPICLPAVVITDKDDTIIYSYISGSLRVRPNFNNLWKKVSEIERQTYNTEINEID